MLINVGLYLVFIRNWLLNLVKLVPFNMIHTLAYSLLHGMLTRFIVHYSLYVYKKPQVLTTSEVMLEMCLCFLVNCVKVVGIRSTIEYWRVILM